MNDRGPGRPKRRFALSRVRMVNFHNFVDETIEIRDGGHLFLLGDNGSGKTTALDAVHLALSGGQALELNAAARVGGRRDEGRTLAGIVLRHDAERGLMNEGGATAYTLLELREQGEDGLGEERLCLGIGMEATTMDARVVRWGILRRGPLEELPLLSAEAEGEAPSPTPRDAFRHALEKHETFGQMTDFRRAVAERLFGGQALYEEVCRFWSMAKAYREIVARARDFAGLFARLLPAPDAEVFGEILRSLKAIDDLADGLEQLEAQRGYVAGVAGAAAEIAAHREEVARYRWLRCQWELEETASRAEALAAEVESIRTRCEELDAAVEAADAAVGRAARSVALLMDSDTERLAEALRGAEVALSERSAELAEAKAAHRRSEKRRGETDRACLEAATTLSRVLGETAGRAEQALAAVALVPGDRPALRAAIEAQRALAGHAATRDAPAELAAVDPATRDEQAGAVEAVRAEEDRRRDRVAALEVGLAASREEVRALEARDELGPELPAFTAASAALEAEGLGAEPVYRLLEPRPGANAFELAALEALAGPETLAALVGAPGDAQRIRSVVQREAPGARVVLAEPGGAELPAWAATLLAEPETGAGRRARAFLAASLVQSDSLGPVGPPDVTGALELRAGGFRQPADSPRLLGADARRRARDERLSTARERLGAAEAELADARRSLETSRASLARLRELGDALRELRGRAVYASHAEERRARQAHAFASEQVEATAGRLEVARDRRGQAAQLVEGLRARAQEKGLAELERRLSELRSSEAAARDRHARALEERAAARARLARTDQEQLASRSEAVALQEARARFADALRPHLDRPMDDSALAHHVQVTQRGQQFRTLGGIEERLREAERGGHQREAEIEGDGSRGVRNLRWSPSFGFAWSPDANRIEDRRGQPLSSVLAEIERTLEGQRSVVNERTRELMDKLVMGALARHLQERVDHVDRMVRRINRLLADLRFGATRYQFRVTPSAERRTLVELVRRISVLDDESRHRFRSFIEERVDDLRLGADDEVPELLDYRRWFDYRLTMRTTGAEDVELTRELRRLGSGGEQGVPNYLLVLALAKLMFDNADARLRPLLFDEAFYGIDAGRRDQLLRFATEMGLQLLVASPDQDGVTRAVRHATTVFVLKDDRADVHLAPHHYWNLTGRAQADLFPEGPEEAPAEEAACVVGAEPAPPEQV